METQDTEPDTAGRALTDAFNRFCRFMFLILGRLPLVTFLNEIICLFLESGVKRKDPTKNADSLQKNVFFRGTFDEFYGGWISCILGHSCSAGRTVAGFSYLLAITDVTLSGQAACL
jgi:hypothetical protein